MLRMLSPERIMIEIINLSLRLCLILCLDCSEESTEGSGVRPVKSQSDHEPDEEKKTRITMRCNCETQLNRQTGQRFNINFNTDI